MKARLAGIVVALHALLFPTAALVQQRLVGDDLLVENAWTRAAGELGGAAEVYFTLRNTSERTIDLIGVRADVASIETLHKIGSDTTGAPRMSAIPELRVEPGASATLEPGGPHVMLIDLERSLVEGTTLSLRLTFYDGDDLTIEVPILGADATGPQNTATAARAPSD
ncbi:copper chaperone PCu(A)C [Sedimentitalea sp. XS_ASV28]|uniref:copper chaperone PCu(A)C n=1 Tax=Sedimentitalea sp. XS_ASV28 TaxID=3241296 RepID=UPI003516E0DB